MHIAMVNGKLAVFRAMAKLSKEEDLIPQRFRVELLVSSPRSSTPEFFHVLFDFVYHDCGLIPE